MKKLLLFTLALALFSCDKKVPDIDLEGCDLQYKLILRDNNQYGNYLSENIEKYKAFNSNSIAYHTINTRYIQYLDSITQQVNEDGWQLFFEGDKYSKIGKEFIARTNKCEKELSKLIEDENLKQRIHYILNTNDLEQGSKSGEIAPNNEGNVKKLNVIYFKYLDYYFRGLPKDYIEVVLSNKKRALLELENEYLVTQKQIH